MKNTLILIVGIVFSSPHLFACIGSKGGLKIADTSVNVRQLAAHFLGASWTENFEHRDVSASDLPAINTQLRNRANGLIQQASESPYTAITGYSILLSKPNGVITDSNGCIVSLNVVVERNDPPGKSGVLTVAVAPGYYNYETFVECRTDFPTFRGISREPAPELTPTAELSDVSILPPTGCYLGH